MSSFEDAIWAHLVDQHGVDRTEFRVPTPAERRGVRPAAAIAGGVVLTAIVAVMVLIFSASTSTSPAYALTPAADGSYTVSLNDLSTGIPAVNAELAQLGIRETVVPIVAGCTASDPVQAGAGSLSQTVTISSGDIPAGYRGYIAAEPLPNGRIGLALGDTEGPIPSCFPPATSHGIPAPNQHP